MRPEQFLDVFTAGWSAPQPEGFIDYFTPLSHPDVVATQPLLPTAVGAAAYMRSFRNTFGLIRGMRIEVVKSAYVDDTIFIASVVTGRIGGRPLRFEVSDRFVLRDDLIYRRQSYFDPTPIVVGILLRPWVLPAVLRCLRG